ncbi:hypothetical protein K493DRAFT_319586 [Basidiobolus meristosporus CBS 931.73]|uniref:Carbohydrate-binding module family 19 domain-containing protein n=1 Tax=Basidiobolus meristosporus CBS 931.73 TaxID=1314790 RepID=A0A1Y1XQC5_9FUNG|nr:hypothetical protein K493DRAFT_319586 [Basidiobolus meristosporus CBS 931.73]|eukprot:ORX87941.1 hypothetical protein K493DRAFT_319586 [Basidiobolus meristosporus CBS 931.73]
MFTPVQTPIVTVATSCVDGTYQCVDSGKSVEFTVCNNGKLVTEACAPGTVCKTVKDSILCDWA